jgi:hypothetical protein
MASITVVVLSPIVGVSLGRCCADGGVEPAFTSSINAASASDVVNQATMDLTPSTLTPAATAPEVEHVTAPEAAKSTAPEVIHAVCQWTVLRSCASMGHNILTVDDSKSLGRSVKGRPT